MDRGARMIWERASYSFAPEQLAAHNHISSTALVGNKSYEAMSHPRDY